MATLRIPVGPEDHIQGSSSAQVTVVEYGDYECPYCAAAQPMIKRVQSHFGASLRLVFRHFPLTEVHPNAGPAAETAEFAAAHGSFWPMHEALFANQEDLSPRMFFQLAGMLRLSDLELRDALLQATYATKVRAHFIGGVRSGVNGTPTFFVNSLRLDLPPSLEALSKAITAQFSLHG